MRHEFGFLRRTSLKKRGFRRGFQRVPAGSSGLHDINPYQTRRAYPPNCAGSTAGSSGFHVVNRSKRVAASPTGQRPPAAPVFWMAPVCFWAVWFSPTSGFLLGSSWVLPGCSPGSLLGSSMASGVRMLLSRRPCIFKELFCPGLVQVQSRTKFSLKSLGCPPPSKILEGDQRPGAIWSTWGYPAFNLVI